MYLFGQRGSAEARPPFVGPVQPQRLRRDADHGRVEIQMQHMIVFPTRTRTPRGRLWWLTTTARSDAAVPSATQTGEPASSAQAASPTPARAASGARRRRRAHN